MALRLADKFRKDSLKAMGLWPQGKKAWCEVIEVMEVIVISAIRGICRLRGVLRIANNAGQPSSDFVISFHSLGWRCGKQDLDGHPALRLGRGSTEEHVADRLRMLEKLENISLAAASLPDTILKVRHSRAMLFINPMWDNEAERIGKQKCTPLGYALHAFSDLLGFVALFLVFGVTAYLGYRRIVREFRASLLWIFSIPFGLAIIGSILYQISWVLAQRRGFCYDYESREASWIDHGQRHTYKSNDA